MIYKDLQSELRSLKDARDYLFARINYEETNDNYICYFKGHLEKVLARINEIEKEIEK